MNTLFDTPRLLVQSIDLAQDTEALLVIHNHHNTMRWIPNNKAQWTTADLAQKYQRNTTLYPQQLGLYKIVRKDQNTSVLIGEMGLFPCTPSTLTTLEIGYILHEKFWKQGLATELLQGLDLFIAQSLPHTIIRAQLFDENIASKNLLERCGYQYDGVEPLPGQYRKLIYSKQIIR
ncbi:GNAT family N-acetyltransferase [Myroides sp. DW712]|uniref:GNAT family N-acetyltransferase n=1 Tax=Myroides sp. DW712 TaxID=3389800 RepID=UPI00397CB897